MMDLDKTFIDEIVARETAAISDDDSRNLMLASGVTQKKSSNIHSDVDIEYDREGTLSFLSIFFIPVGFFKITIMNIFKIRNFPIIISTNECILVYKTELSNKLTTNLLFLFDHSKVSIKVPNSLIIRLIHLPDFNCCLCFPFQNS